MACAVLLYFLALAATATFGQEPIKWTGIYVRWRYYWTTGPNAPASGAFKMPLSTDEARKGGWAKAASTNLTTTWCFEKDPSLCPLYDMQGTFAGMQISIPVADFVFPGNDSIDNHPLWFKNNMYNRELYSTRFYLVDQATLAAGGRPPSEEVGTGLWLQSGPDLVEVPRDRRILKAQSWTRQNCLLAIGRHYYYKMSKEMSCEDLQPYFLLLDDKYNSLVGVGLQMIGKFFRKTRRGFNGGSRSIIDRVTPNAPTCLKNLAEKYGITFIHMYFIEKSNLLRYSKNK